MEAHHNEQETRLADPADLPIRPFDCLVAHRRDTYAELVVRRRRVEKRSAGSLVDVGKDGTVAQCSQRESIGCLNINLRSDAVFCGLINHIQIIDFTGENDFRISNRFVRLAVANLQFDNEWRALNTYCLVIFPNLISNRLRDGYE